MEQVVEINSNFNTLKLLQVWLVILLLPVFPEIVSLTPFFNTTLDFNILSSILSGFVALGLILYLKISLNVIIYPQEQIIEYNWRRIWGKKHKISINMGDAYINLKLLRYKGNELWDLSIRDTNSGKKIRLTEVMDGFDEKQIKYIYQMMQIKVEK
jgi:hypothetical protein